MSCYRENVQHFREESHPAEHVKAETITGFLVDASHSSVFEVNTDTDSDYDDVQERSKSSLGKRKPSTKGKAKAPLAAKGKANSSTKGKAKAPLAAKGKAKSSSVKCESQSSAGRSTTKPFGIENLLVRFRRAVPPLLEQTTKVERGSRTAVKAANKLQLGYSKRALHSAESGGHSTPAKHSQGMGLNSGSTKLGKLEGGGDFMGLCSELLRAKDPVKVPVSCCLLSPLSSRLLHLSFKHQAFAKLWSSAGAVILHHNCEISREDQQ
jgi:hypothetical protein